MNTTQRPTPETDALHAKQGLTHAQYWDFARQLERERDEAREELASCNAFNENEIIQELQTNCLTLTTQNERLIGEREAMREAIREVSNFITSFEYNGNEKGTRCISCYSHCSERHRQDCVLQTALAKLKPYLP